MNNILQHAGMYNVYFKTYLLEYLYMSIFWHCTRSPFQTTYFTKNFIFCDELSWLKCLPFSVAMAIAPFAHGSSQSNLPPYSRRQFSGRFEPCSEVHGYEETAGQRNVLYKPCKIRFMNYVLFLNDWCCVNNMRKYRTDCSCSPDLIECMKSIAR